MSSTSRTSIIIGLFIIASSCVVARGQDSKEEKLKACGTQQVKYKVSTDKKQHPTPDAPADKALIYILRSTRMGKLEQSKTAVDGEWKGASHGDSYFFFTVDPGERYFCAQAENQDYVKLKVEAGKTYYLWQTMQLGIVKGRTKLVVMTEEEGRKKPRGVHLSVFKKKN